MSDDITRRLREAATAVGDTIDHSRGLEFAGGRGKRPWLIPVVAAASVTAVIAAGVVGGKVGAAGDRLAAAGSVAPPRFLLTASSDELTVHGVDGKAITRVPKPSGDERFELVGAAQDNRRFYVTTTDQGTCRARFYRLTLNDSGGVGSLDPLSLELPKSMLPTSLAVSGDGGKLAYSLGQCAALTDPGRVDVDPTTGREAGKKAHGATVEAGETSRLVLANTDTGESRTWTASGRLFVDNVSMTADGRYIAYQYWDHIFDSDGMKPENMPDSYLVVDEPRDAGEKGGTVRHQEQDAPSGSVTVSPSPGVQTMAPASPPPTGKAPAPSESPVSLSTTLSELPPRSAEGAATPTSAAPSGKPSGSVDLDSAYRSFVEFEMVHDSPEVYLLDTTASGEDLGHGRKVTLETDMDSGPGGVFGFQVSADGSRIVAALGRIPETVSDGKLVPLPTTAAVAEFDAANGRRVGSVHQDDKGGMRLLDADAAGERFLVQRGTEIASVSKDGYQALTTSEHGAPRSATW